MRAGRHHYSVLVTGELYLAAGDCARNTSGSQTRAVPSKFNDTDEGPFLSSQLTKMLNLLWSQT